MTYQMKEKIKKQRHMGEWRYSSTHFDLSTRWRWVVSFMLQQLHLQRKSPQFTMERKVSGI